MTTPVKERLKTEFQQAKVEGKQRAMRIGDILKNAASMTFDEIKEGSFSLNVSARKSIAEILEDLNETPEEAPDMTPETTSGTTPGAVLDTTNGVVAEDVTDSESDATDVAPSWKTILGHAVKLVRDRRGGWLQAVKEHLTDNASKLNQDLTELHGDRYLKVKQIFKRIVNRFKSAQAEASRTEGTDYEPSQPVSIEVVEGDTQADGTTTRLIEPEA